MSDKKHQVTHTNADKVLDAVAEVRKQAEVKPGCPVCGSMGYETRRPLGGPLIRVCTDCGNKMVGARGNSRALIEARYPHSQGSGKGPVKKSLSGNQSKPQKYQPKYRGKK